MAEGEAELHHCPICSFAFSALLLQAGEKTRTRSFGGRRTASTERRPQPLANR